MSRLKIALSELEANDADQFRAALGRLTGRLSHYWEWSDLASAELVIVDMDSMFGHMAWLKAHGANKHVITFARSGQVQGSDLVLGKPLDDDALAAVLEQAAGMMAHSDSALRGAESAAAPAKPAAHEASAPKAAPKAAPKPAPTPVAKPTPAERPRTASVMNLSAVAEMPPPKPEAAPEPAPKPVESEPEPVNIADLLVRRPPTRAMRVGGSELVIDSERDVYYADDALKPLKEPLEQKVSALQSLDAGALATARQRKPHPLARLRWFAGLVATPGVLAHGLRNDERYKLARWPQTEREFPRHFRIATAMMKEAATPADLAASSGVPLPEVIDYINASKAAGWLAIERDEPPPNDEDAAQKGKGLGRFRKTPK
ncbi:MAG TPA: hypothetical protein VFP88_00730 [Rhodanobacteraceae bacterium]|nr:hypothetical protein [Rhodanobacteraceae bacterium]